VVGFYEKIPVKTNVVTVVTQLTEYRILDVTATLAHKVINEPAYSVFNCLTYTPEYV
jgi:hypothetical protein